MSDIKKARAMPYRENYSNYIFQSKISSKVIKLNKEDGARPYEINSNCACEQERDDGYFLPKETNCKDW